MAKINVRRKRNRQKIYLFTGAQRPGLKVGLKCHVMQFLRFKVITLSSQCKGGFPSIMQNDLSSHRNDELLLLLASVRKGKTERVESKR